MKKKVVILLMFLIITLISIKYFEKYDENEYLRDIIVKIYSQNITFDNLKPFIKTSSQSIGTGFFISEDIILTASHVVQNSIRIDFTIPSIGKKKFKTELICFNPYFDMALLKSSEIKRDKYLKLGDSDKIKSGDKVFAVGYPLGQEKLKFTSGIISGINDGEIQTDAPINPGNSGGPLLNSKKEVIGINVSGFTDAENIGYAVPINRFKLYKNDMLNSKDKISHKPIIGGEYVSTNQEILDFFKIKDDGVLIKKVFKNGPLDIAGIKSGDILSKFGKFNVDKYGDIKVAGLSEKMSFNEIFNDFKINDVINVVVYRKNKKLNKEVKLQSVKFYKIREIFPLYESLNYLIISGIIFSNLNLKLLDYIDNPDIYKYYQQDNQLDNVVIISNILNGSYVNNLNIVKPGNILNKINGKNVSTCIDLLSTFKEIKNKQFIYFEFDNGVKLILKSNKIIEEDKFLSQQHNYKIIY